MYIGRKNLLLSIDKITVFNLELVTLEYLPPVGSAFVIRILILSAHIALKYGWGRGEGITILQQNFCFLAIMGGKRG